MFIVSLMHSLDNAIGNQMLVCMGSEGLSVKGLKTGGESVYLIRELHIAFEPFNFFCFYGEWLFSVNRLVISQFVA